MILRIYKHLHAASGIVALNSTSRTHYWIWRLNATSISHSVLPRSIEAYDSALEQFEVDERVQRIRTGGLDPSTTPKRVRVAQREARVAVQQGGRNDRRDHISRDARYRLVLHRNGRLLAAAHGASHLVRLVENNVVYGDGTPHDGFDIVIPPPPSSQDVRIAYHDLSTLICLHSLQAMRDRLQAVCGRRIRNMLHVAIYLVCDCPDQDKIRLGISRRLTPREAAAKPWSWALDYGDMEFRPRCQMIVPARRAFFAVADAMGHPCIPDRLLDNRSRCHGDCEAFGMSEVD